MRHALHRLVTAPWAADCGWLATKAQLSYWEKDVSFGVREMLCWEALAISQHASAWGNQGCDRSASRSQEMHCHFVTLSLCLDQENQDQNKALCDCDLDACEVFGFACSRFLPQGLDSTLQERRWHFSFRPLPSKYIQATCTFCFSQQDCPSEYCAVPDCTDHRSMEFLEWTFSEDYVGSTRRGLFIEEAC